MTTKAEAAELLAILRTKEIVRQSAAGGVYGLHPLVEQGIEELAPASGSRLRDAAVAAFVEYCLHVADDAAALNASNAQVSRAGRTTPLCHFRKHSMLEVVYFLKLGLQQSKLMAEPQRTMCETRRLPDALPVPALRLWTSNAGGGHVGH